MGFKAIVCFGLLMAIILQITSHVAARDLAETTTSKTNETDSTKLTGSFEEVVLAFMEETRKDREDQRRELSEHRRDMSELKGQVSRLTLAMTEKEKGKFPSQPEPKPSRQVLHTDVNALNESGSVMAISAKEELKVCDEVEEESVFDEGEEVEDEGNAYVSLSDLMKKVPKAAKTLRDMCNFKKKFCGRKIASLNGNVSAILQNEKAINVKDPSAMAIPVSMGATRVDHALLDLGASVNVMPLSLYEKLGLGEMEKTDIVLQLANQTEVKPRGVLENVIVNVCEFKYPVDFVIVDMQPQYMALNKVSLILGRPFLATSDALISARSGMVKLKCGDHSMKINAFNCSQEVAKEAVAKQVDVIEKVKKVKPKGEQVVKVDGVKKVLGKKIKKMLCLRSELKEDENLSDIEVAKVERNGKMERIQLLDPGDRRPC